MPQPDRDTANYALHYFSNFDNEAEGIPEPEFFHRFMHLCLSASDSELETLSLAYPDYVAAFRLTRSLDGWEVLRQLAHPDPT